MSVESKVCKKCGWYEHGPYRPRECDPKRGAAARAVIAALPGVESTMLGYGFGNLVVGKGLDDFDFTLQFEVDRHGTFQWRDVTCFKHDLTKDEVVDLTKTLLAWRERCEAKRAKP